MKKLQEFDTLAEAQACPYVTTKMISGDQMRIFMIQTGLYGYFKNHTSDAQMAAYDNMFGGEFNFIEGHPSNVTPLFLLIISQAESPDRDADLTTLLGLCQSYANDVTYPYADITQEEFDACKLAYSELTTHELEWDGRKTHLKITLHEDLYEPVNVTTFYTDTIYTTPENLGRPKRLRKAGEYIIDLTNVRKTGTLFVNFNIKANATCELV